MSHVTRTPLSRLKGQRLTCRGVGILWLTRVYIVNIHQLVNIHGAHSCWKQGALGAAGVRDGLQLGAVDCALLSLLLLDNKSCSRRRHSRSYVHIAALITAGPRSWLQSSTLAMWKGFTAIHNYTSQPSTAQYTEYRWLMSIGRELMANSADKNRLTPLYCGQTLQSPSHGHWPARSQKFGSLHCMA